MTKDLGDVSNTRRNYVKITLQCQNKTCDTGKNVKNNSDKHQTQKAQTALLYEKILYDTFRNLQRKINRDSVTFILTEQSVIKYEAS